MAERKSYIILEKRKTVRIQISVSAHASHVPLCNVCTAPSAAVLPLLSSSSPLPSLFIITHCPSCLHPPTLSESVLRLSLHTPLSLFFIQGRLWAPDSKETGIAGALQNATAALAVCACLCVYLWVSAWATGVCLNAFQWSCAAGPVWVWSFSYRGCIRTAGRRDTDVSGWTGKLLRLPGRRGLWLDLTPLSPPSLCLLFFTGSDIWEQDYRGSWKEVTWGNTRIYWRRWKSPILKTKCFESLCSKSLRLPSVSCLPPLLFIRLVPCRVPAPPCPWRSVGTRITQLTTWMRGSWTTAASWTL